MFNRNLSNVTYNNHTVSLSLRQTEILSLLAEHLGSTVDRKDILKKIWGDDSIEDSLALNVQITYLRHILKADNSISIVSLKKKGYILMVN